MSPNRDMVELWNGEQTSAWVEAPDRYDLMLAPFSQAVLRAADLRPGDRVLDVGCGSGALTREIADAVSPEGSVVGVDIAQPLLDLARRTSTAPAARFEHADAQSDDIGGPYDAVLSRFGVMFFDDPVAAFTNLASATAPSGRLAFVCWQPLLNNAWALTAVMAAAQHVALPAPPEPGAPGPFAFGEQSHVQDILSRTGWVDVQMEACTPELLVYGGRTAEEAARGFHEDAFGRALLEAAEPEQQDRAVEALIEALRAHEKNDGVRLPSATWLVTARRP